MWLSVIHSFINIDPHMPGMTRTILLTQHGLEDYSNACSCVISTTIQDVSMVKTTYDHALV